MHIETLLTDVVRGVIASVSDSEIVVVYDVDGDIIEHTYPRSRFQRGVQENDSVELESILRVVPRRERNERDRQPLR